ASCGVDLSFMLLSYSSARGRVSLRCGNIAIIVEELTAPSAGHEVHVATLHLRCERLGTYLLRTRDAIGEHPVSGEIAYGRLCALLAAGPGFLFHTNLVAADPTVALVSLRTALDLLLAIERGPLPAHDIADDEAPILHQMHERAGRVGAAIRRARLVPVTHAALEPGPIPDLHVADLLDREHAAAHHNRVLLVLRFPRGLRLHLLAFQQKVDWLVLGKERLAFLAKARRDGPVAGLGDRRVAQHLGLREPLDPPPSRVVDVPAREDHDQSGVLAKSSKEVVGEPVPSHVARNQALRLGAALHGVIDDADVQAEAGDLTAYRRVAEAAGRTHQFNQVACTSGSPRVTLAELRQPGELEYLLILRRPQHPLQRQVGRHP